MPYWCALGQYRLRFCNSGILGVLTHSLRVRAPGSTGHSTGNSIDRAIDFSHGRRVKCTREVERIPERSGNFQEIEARVPETSG